MVPTVRASATYASTASETGTVPLPSGWQAGDIIYVGYELTASSGVLSVPRHSLQAQLGQASFLPGPSMTT
jgi:hypothetical protein